MLKARVRHMAKLHLRNKKGIARWLSGSRCLLSSLMTRIQVSRTHTVNGENKLLKVAL